jgi:hypothetical protein
MATTPTPQNNSTDPQVPSDNVRIDNVFQSELAQKDPALYQQWQRTFIDRASTNAANAITAEEATLGRSLTAEERASIERFSTLQARNETNAVYQTELQAANVVTVVPTDTPPPTTAAPTVSPDANPEVPTPPAAAAPPTETSPVAVANDPQVVVPPTRVVAVSSETLLQNDPDTAREYTAFKNETAEQLTAQRIAEQEAANGGFISVSAQAQIAARANIDATADANFRYQDQIEAAGAGTVVPRDTSPPTPSPVTVANDPQVFVPPTRVASVSTETLLQNDPETAQEYTAFKNETAQELTAQRIAEAEAALGESISVSAQAQIAARAEIDATADANFRFQDQIEAAGAGTVVPADTPPPTVIATPVDSVTNQQVPQPDSFPEEGIDLPVTPAAGVDPQIPQPDSFPEEGIDAPAPVESPTPYERFLAQEAAATDAAQAEATARFNAQFEDGGDIIASADDPQAFPVTDPGDGIVVVEIEPLGDEFSGYEDFYGTEEFNNVGEFEAEPVGDEFSGYDDFYGFEDDVGEFQIEPALVDDEFSGYSDFFGADDDFGVGEFQIEPTLVDDDNSGYSNFFGADDDVGEFQIEPATGDGESAGFSNFFGGDDEFGGGNFLGGLFGSPGAVSPGSDPLANLAQQFALDSISGLVKSAIKTPNQLAAERQAAAKAQAQAQAQVNAQRKQANEGDWRVRLRLAGGADYLYKAKGANGKSAAGILEPLAVTDGVIFPYTPQITTQYTAKYNPYELTHSNYKGYFYQGSSVNEISITATFTAQDTSEANYLLAVIHFFRSVTKMFYGQDDASKRGAPPPLVFLQGLGEYQFNLHPCVVSSFNYILPNDVDYIRANSVNFDGTNLLQRRDRQNLPIDYVNSVSSRLSNAGLTKGGLNTPPPPPTLGTKSPTYVPTKMEIQLVLLPMQTRSQVSQQFSLKQFANGDLIRGGFW